MKSRKMLKHKTRKNRKITKKQIMRGGGMFDLVTKLFGKKEKQQQEKQQQEEGDVPTPEFGTRINQMQQQSQSQPNQNSFSINNDEDEHVSTGEMTRRRNANGTLPNQQIISAVKQQEQEQEGDPDSGMIDEKKEIIMYLYKQLIKIKLNTWSNTFYYKSVKKCKPDFSKLLYFLKSFIDDKFNYSYVNKILDSINVITLNKFCFKLNKKLPSLLNDLKQAITIYLEQSNIKLDNENLTHDNILNTTAEEEISNLREKYNMMDQQIREVEEKRLYNARRNEKLKTDFLKPQPAVYPEKMLFNQRQQQFSRYISTPPTQGGKTKKRSKKMRSKCQTKSKSKK